MKSHKEIETTNNNIPPLQRKDGNWARNDTEKAEDICMRFLLRTQMRIRLSTKPTL